MSKVQMESIPTVDLSSITDLTDDFTIPEEFLESLVNFGAVYVIGHGMDENLMEGLLESSQELFGRSLSTKRHAKQDPRNELVVFHTAGPEISLEETEIPGAEREEEEEEFEQNVPNKNCPTDYWFELENTIGAYIDGAEKLKVKLFKLLAQSLGVVDLTLIGGCGQVLRGSQNCSSLRWNKYPVIPGKHKEDKIRCAEHTDWGVFTFVNQDSTGGLEVKNRRGEWIPVPQKPGAILLLCGDILETWTNGLIPAAPHRVLATAQDQRCRQERYAIVYFVLPDNGVIIKPLKKFAISGSSSSKVVPKSVLELIRGHTLAPSA